MNSSQVPAAVRRQRWSTAVAASAAEERNLVAGSLAEVAGSLAAVAGSLAEAAGSLAEAAGNLAEAAGSLAVAGTLAGAGNLAEAAESFALAGTRCLPEAGSFALAVGSQTC